MNSELFKDVRSKYIKEVEKQAVGEFDELISKFAKEGSVIAINEKDTAYGKTYERCQRNKKFYEKQGFVVKYETVKAPKILTIETYYYHKLTIQWN